MGWTSYYAWHYLANGSVDRKAECRDYIFGGMNSEWAKKHRLLADCMDGSTYYAAIKDEDTGEVWACVCMTQVHEGEIYIKEMSEGMGPGQRTCPDRILDLLTPTDDEWAIGWRADCRKNNLKKKGFAKLPLGTRAIWTATFGCDAFSAGDKVSLVKSRQSRRGKSPYVWTIVGTRYCLRPRMVDIADLEFSDAAEAKAS